MKIGVFQQIESIKKAIMLHFDIKTCEKMKEKPKLEEAEETLNVSDVKMLQINNYL